MNEKLEINPMALAEERAANIDRLAKPIIEDAQKRERERPRRNEMEMEKLYRWLAHRPKMTPSGSQSIGGTTCNR
jgi:hypothetical protein